MNTETYLFNYTEAFKRNQGLISPAYQPGIAEKVKTEPTKPAKKQMKIETNNFGKLMGIIN